MQVNVADFVGSCAAIEGYVGRRDNLLTGTLTVSILLLLLWALVIIERACCWRYVVKKKLAVHHHYHHREKMALAMLESQHKDGSLPGAGADGGFTGWKAKLHRAAREIAIKEQIHHTRIFLEAREKHKGCFAHVWGSIGHVRKWWAHNCSLSLTFEGDANHSGRFYGPKTMFSEALEAGLQFWGLVNSTEASMSTAIVHGVTLLANTFFSPVVIACKLWSFAVAVDCMFQVVYMVIAYKGIVQLFYPSYTIAYDRLPEANNVNATTLAIKLLTFFSPFTSLLMLLPMAWDNVMLARVYAKLAKMKHPIAERGGGKIETVAEEQGKKEAAHPKHTSHGCGHCCQVFLPWLYVMFMWAVCFFLLTAMSTRPYCTWMRTCAPQCTPVINLPETDPELLNRPVKTSTTQHCLLGKWQGVLTYRYEDAINGSQASVSFLQF